MPSSDTSDWISGGSALLQTLIGLVTLLTVYIAALQLASQNRLYRLGVSWRSLGPWKRKAEKGNFFGLQRRILAPTVSLSNIVKKQWTPRLTLPSGFPKKQQSDRCIEEADNVLAKASWVNFMQALGLSPEDQTLYEMEDASELVNGVVPMSWAGKDLVGICSILGFSCKKQPKAKKPMPLPIHWAGPLGHIQVRASANGCVAEFIPRGELIQGISDNMHNYWRNAPLPSNFQSVQSRLWNSIGGLCLPDQGLLFLGGADKTDGDDDDEEDGSEGMRTEKLLQDLTSSDYSDKHIIRKLFGSKAKRPEDLVQSRDKAHAGGGQAELPKSMEHQTLAELMEAALKKKIGSRGSGLKEVIQSCPGLLSVIIEGDLAHNRGIRVPATGRREYHRKFTRAEDVDNEKFPYHLGNLVMDEEVLGLMKEALLLLIPDGFYFSPSPVVWMDLKDAYKHIQSQCKKRQQIFEDSNKRLRLFEEQLDKPEGLLSGEFSSKSVHDVNAQHAKTVYYAMTLCNQIHRTCSKEQVTFSVNDMVLMTKARHSLKPIIESSPNGRDLVWAMLSCAELSRDIRKALELSDLREFISCPVTSLNEVLDCSNFVFSSNDEKDADDVLEDFEDLEKEEKEKLPKGKYRIKHLGNGEFTGMQLLAALCDVLLRHFWISACWVTNVSVYESTIPQTVTMV